MNFLAWSGDALIEYGNMARTEVNNLCFGLEPWQVMAYTFAATTVALWLLQFLESDKRESLIETIGIFVSIIGAVACVICSLVDSLQIEESMLCNATNWNRHSFKYPCTQCELFCARSFCCLSDQTTE